MAVGIESFYLPHNMVTGGFSGISIIITRYMDKLFSINIPISVINLCLNLPLFILTFFLLGFKMVIRSFYATIILTISLFLVTFLPAIETDLFIASVFGGIFSGVGLGLVFSRFSTTGGTDLVAMILRKYFKSFNVSKLLFMIDCSVILLGLFAFGVTNCMYAIVSIYICTKVINQVLEGLSFKNVCYIITDHYEELSEVLLQELDRGVTGLESKGMYTKKQRVTLMVVISTKDIPKLKEITKRIDEKAFIILTEATEVLGEGFSKFEEDLA